MQLRRLRPSRACSLRSPGAFGIFPFFVPLKKKLKYHKSKAPIKFHFLHVVSFELHPALREQAEACTTSLSGLGSGLGPVSSSPSILEIHIWATERGHARALALGNGPDLPRPCRSSGASGTHSLCSCACPLKDGTGRRSPRCEKLNAPRNCCWEMFPRPSNAGLWSLRFESLQPRWFECLTANCEWRRGCP